MRFFSGTIVLFLLVFFSLNVHSAANCGVNPPNSTGIEDCGVEADLDNDGVFEHSYTSMQAFFTNGFPSTVKVGETEFKYKAWVRNDLGVPVLNVFVSCGFWQYTANTSIKAFPYTYEKTNLVLAPNETDSIEVSFDMQNLLVLANTTNVAAGCSLYNQQSVTIAGGSKNGINLNTGSQNTKIEVSGITFPADGHTGTNYNLGETVALEYKIKNKGDVPLTATAQSEIYYSTRYLYENCLIKEDNANEGIIAAAGTAGDEKTLQCKHKINLLEGLNNSIVGDTIFNIGGQKFEAQASKAYTVSGPSYSFTRLSPFNIYGNIGGELFVDYQLAQEVAIPGDIFFIAIVKKETDAIWKEAYRWNYSWNTTAPTGNKQQSLSEFNIASVLEPGKNTILLMAFKNGIPTVLPNLPVDYKWGPANTGSPDLFDWVSTNFSVPRMLQPDNEAFFPAGQKYPLASQSFQLGLRNLSNVSPLGQTIPYNLSLSAGNPATITDIDVGCDGTIDYPAWQNLTFNFDKTLPEEIFSSPVYGGTASGLNEKICMQINSLEALTFNFRATTDIPGTTLDETKLAENLTIQPSKPQIKIASFKISPDVITEEGKTAKVLLQVINSGKTDSKITAEIKIKDSKGTVKYSQETTKTIAQNSTASINDFSFTTDNSWIKGNYIATITLKNSAGDSLDATNAYFTIVSVESAVPETEWSMLPIIALIVISIAYFTTKKASK